MELFKSIRFGFLTSEDLLKMNSNPIYDLAKSLIVEGLSVKLDPNGAASKNLNII